ncbi:gamma-glutamylputrescine oxidoreductase [mine drainage metagenome]|uniref:Gamma-glutamylputrescine oxidoreductase n=1 Tax=mine drainage metagenome TaxID=410659 RepID=A0A1J5QMZ7_9ZZZZ
MPSRRASFIPSVPVYGHDIPSSAARAAVRPAAPRPFWLDDPDRPAPLAPLTGAVTTDLVVVGGGYSGLWTALQAKERDPGRDVVLVEAHRIGWAASGRNGGFCAASLTHGDANGEQRFPLEMPLLRLLGQRNLEGLVETIDRYEIDAQLERTGTLDVATEEYQVADLLQQAAESDGELEFLDQEQVQSQIASPLFRAGLRDRTGTVVLNPARLAWGLRDACLALGVRIVEGTPARTIRRDSDRVVVETDGGHVTAAHAALATNAFPSLLKRVDAFVVPVYDYALMTRPLSDAELASVGWSERAGLGDVGNQFHYARLSADNRILWGGYDAVYHRGGRIRPEYEQRLETFERLAHHFQQTFPQLTEVEFTHAWGGVIDTCSRFFPFFGTALGGRVAYVAGYTGLGVGSTRFGARVMLDLLDVPERGETELTTLSMVRRFPVPFPPEPLAYPVIEATRWSLDRADHTEGKRNLWLRTLDTLGLGFDS